MKTYFTAAVAIFAILLFSSGGLLVTHAETYQALDHQDGGHGTSQALYLSIGMGGVVSAGNQRYSLSEYGTPLMAMLNGAPLANPHLSYNLEANVQGMSVTGSGSFVLSGQDSTGSNVVLKGNVQISGSVPAACFNGAGMDMSGCSSSDTSQVPAEFTGVGTIQTGSAQGGGNQGGNGQGGDNHGGNNQHNTFGFSTNDQQQSSGLTVPMVFESPYDNPFGNAIIFGDANTVAGTPQAPISLLVVTNYTRATIAWSNVNDAGMVSGKFGSTPVGGMLSQVATEYENLVTGNALDYGTFTLASMANATGPVPALDATGGYYGTSTIPHAGAQACGSSTMIGPFQTCTMTGFQDQGHFFLKGGQGSSSSLIVGSYSSTWLVPALGIATSTITATIYQH